MPGQDPTPRYLMEKNPGERKEGIRRRTCIQPRTSDTRAGMMRDTIMIASGVPLRCAYAPAGRLCSTLAATVQIAVLEGHCWPAPRCLEHQDQGLGTWTEEDGPAVPLHAPDRHSFELVLRERTQTQPGTGGDPAGVVTLRQIELMGCRCGMMREVGRRRESDPAAGD